MCFTIVVIILREKHNSIVLGKMPGRLQDQSQMPRESHSPDHTTAAGRGNYCLGDPEIQGQLCFNKTGNVPPLQQLCLNHIKEPCATRTNEKEIKYYTAREWFSPGGRVGP